MLFFAKITRSTINSRFPSLMSGERFWKENRLWLVGGDWTRRVCPNQICGGFNKLTFKNDNNDFSNKDPPLQLVKVDNLWLPNFLGVWGGGFHEETVILMAFCRRGRARSARFSFLRPDQQKTIVGYINFSGLPQEKKIKKLVKVDI